MFISKMSRLPCGSAVLRLHFPAYPLASITAATTTTIPQLSSPRPHLPAVTSILSSNSPSSKRLFASSQTALKMASDDDYMAFLNKANEDPAAGVRHASSSASPSEGGDVRTKTVTEGEKIPASIKNIDAYYVSDTDADFQPVVLKFDQAKQGKWPESSEFFSLILPDREHSLLALLSIQETEVAYWDPHNQYEHVIKAVQKAAGSDEVRIYKLNIGEPRAEYWVLALDKKQGRLVGLKALAVES